jgi:thiol-disulfide isomerase/thioredoxin
MMRRPLQHFAVVSGLLIPMVVAGCSSPASDPGGPGAREPVPDRDAAKTPSIEVSLVEVDAEAWREALRTHEGKVVLVDFWATWCAPCKQAFPKLLQYGQDYAGHGLVVMSVSLDDPSERDGVLQFLHSVDAAIPNFISTWGAGTESMEEFGIDSALPYYHLYDRSGALRHQFSGAADGLDHVEPLDRLTERLRAMLTE